MRIAIVDDERISRRELIFLLKSIWPFAEYIEASSGEEAQKIFEIYSFQVIFLDINLGDISGVTLASYLHSIQPNAGVVFVTAYDEYAVKAFGLDAVDYILKPFDLTRIKETATKLESRGYLDDKKLSWTKLALHGGESIILIEQKDIVYIESGQKNCIIHTVDGSYRENRTLISILAKLNKDEFYRVQKSYVVNLNYIKEILPSYNNGYALRMEYYKDNPVPISRNEIKNIKKMFTIT